MKLPGNEFARDPGQTPLDDEDLQGLIPKHIETREELNEWEATNIKNARQFLETRKGGFNVLSVEALAELHRLMFGKTWRWAGTHARTMSQFTDTRTPPSVQLRELVEDTKEMIAASGRSERNLDELAARFHHRLTQIHVWPNGNGRHAREAANQLLRMQGRPPFTWGSGENLQSAGTSRDRYLKALRAADEGDFSELFAFVRS